MKNTMMMVATLLALSLGAQGQTAEGDVVKAWVNANREVVKEDGYPRINLKGDIDGDEAKILLQGVLAKTADKVTGDDCTMMNLVIAHSRDSANVRASTDKMVSLADDAKAPPAIRQMGDATAIMRWAGKGQLKKHADSLGVTDRTAQALHCAARRLGDDSVFDDWCAANRGKGLSTPLYKAWFRKHLAAAPPESRQFEIQQELGGLVRSGKPLEHVKPFADELRYLLYVEKEAK